MDQQGMASDPDFREDEAEDVERLAYENDMGTDKVFTQ
jgi:hypothetical protein